MYRPSQINIESKVIRSERPRRILFLNITNMVWWTETNPNHTSKVKRRPRWTRSVSDSDASPFVQQKFFTTALRLLPWQPGRLMTVASERGVWFDRRKRIAGAGQSVWKYLRGIGFSCNPSVCSALISGRTRLQRAQGRLLAALEAINLRE